MMRSVRLLIPLVLLLSALGVRVQPTLAAGTTITDCPTSETGLQTDISNAGAGGTVSFNCTTDTTIYFDSANGHTGTGATTISSNVKLDASSSTAPVTFDGGSSAEFFVVNSGVTLDLNALTLQNGSATNGGAIFNGGTLTISNSTFANNSATYGGAIENTTTLTISNSTSANNSAGGDGGAIGNYNTHAFGYGTVKIGGSIIANGSGNNCSGPITDEGYNLEWAGTGTSACGFSSTNHDITGQDPKLGSLTDNGGTTQTMALGSASPAIDVIPTTYDIPSTTTLLCPSTDQRGYGRPDNNSETACDIGAYEYQDLRSTTTTLKSSANPSVVGQQVTYTATVSPTPDGRTVSFYDKGTGTTPICSAVPVSTSGSTAGTASCAQTYTTPGQHPITAVYSGDTDFITSTASLLKQTVNQAATTTTLASSSPNNTSTYGQKVTFTATVAVTSPGAGTPTGSVTFSEGSTNLGTGQLAVVNGVDQATFSASSLPVGPHSITASYAGDTNFTGSTSSAVTQYVDTDLSGYTTLSNVNLKGAYLVNANLAGVNLSDSTLSGANLTDANLSGANLSDTNLSNANLTGANLTDATLTDANLKDAILTNATLTGATGMDSAALQKVTWSGTTCPDGTTSSQDGGTCLNNLTP